MVGMEPGDDVSDLIELLGTPYEDFARRHNMNDIVFDITDYVPIRMDFNPAGSPSKNCHGFTSYASGVTEYEGSPEKLDIAGRTPLTSPHTGNWAVFYESGYYQYEGDAPHGVTGAQGHSAIFILRDHSGEAYYLNRINTGEPVSLNSESEIRAFFSNHENVQKRLPGKLIHFPELLPTPKYYKPYR